MVPSREGFGMAGFGKLGEDFNASCENQPTHAGAVPVGSCLAYRKHNRKGTM